MNINDLFGKKPQEEKKYPEVVYKIHHEFETAGGLILKEAMEIISKAPTSLIDKGKRLMTLGFHQVPQAQEAKQAMDKIFISQKQAELVNKYRKLYPLHKFITEQQVKVICEKYNLVCGEIGRYKGFVPEAKIQDIERFVSLRKNEYVEVRLWDSYMPEKITRVPFDVFFKSNVRNKEHFDSPLRKNDCWCKGEEIGYPEYSYASNARTAPLRICAPLKDMDTNGTTLTDGYMMREYYPDPVVLHPVEDGYIIVTAWGDEASDENVVNPIGN